MSNFDLNKVKGKVIVTQLPRATRIKFPWSFQGNARCACSRVACEWGIKFLGLDASQVDGTRVTQKKKTLHTHLQCRKQGLQ